MNVKMENGDIAKLISPGSVFTLIEEDIPEFINQVEQIFKQGTKTDIYKYLDGVWSKKEETTFWDVQRPDNDRVYLRFDNELFDLVTGRYPRFAFLRKGKIKGVYLSCAPSSKEPFTRRYERAYLVEE
jgi:hypothetical protein